MPNNLSHRTIPVKNDNYLQIDNAGDSCMVSAELLRIDNPDPWMPQSGEIAYLWKNERVLSVWRAGQGTTISSTRSAAIGNVNRIDAEIDHIMQKPY